MTTLVRTLCRSGLIRDEPALTDGQLLTCFIERQDEAAFAALVKRPSRMVWGGCRRLLPNHHDAEDAFQAAFLVLVRKATSVRPREMVANWLYGVAYTTAHRARVANARRRAKERQVTDMPEPQAERPDLWVDLQPLLDEELSRLPDKYRVVILLCDLEGKTRTEVARQLQVPEGTVAGRLARARAMLARRLGRRGLVVSGGVLAAVLSEKAVAACVPTSVVSGTVKAGAACAGGPAGVSGLVSGKVAALTDGVLKAMLPNRLKALALVWLVLSVAAVGGGLLALCLAGGQQSQVENSSPRADVPRTAAHAEEKAVPGSDKEKLQGRWKVMSVGFNGRGGLNCTALRFDGQRSSES
jgi:RNA polymerase sigma factor (sigma-70 family)